MSLDKPSGGDRRGDSDRGPEHEGSSDQPGSRPPAPRPAGYRTFDEIRAERAGRGERAERGERGERGERAERGERGGRAGDKTPSEHPPGRVGPGQAPARDAGATAGAGPALRDRGPAQPDASASPRPGTSGGGDPIRLRPFRGQPDDQPPAPRPAGYRTFDEIRAERAKHKPASEYNAAKTTDARRADAATGEEAARPGGGIERRPSDRDRGRDQDRTDGGQTKETAAQAREHGVPADKAGATARPGDGTGDDTRRRPAAQPDKSGQAGQAGTEGHQGSEGPHPTGGADPPYNLNPAGAARGDNGGILHGHSEFHGQNLDLYTDGTRWVSGDAIRAAQAEEARARTEGQPAPQRHGITDIPRMRDLGRNTVGEKEDRSPGDTSGLPPDGRKLVEDADQDKPKMERLKNKLYREIGDVNDAAKNQANSVRDALAHPQPTGHTEMPVPGPVAAPQEAHHAGGSPDSVTQLIVVVGLLGHQTAHWVHRKVSETTRRHDAGHG